MPEPDDLLILGKSLQQTIDGDTKSFPLHYIDWNPATWLTNNVFHVTEEFEVERATRDGAGRDDRVRHLRHRGEEVVVGEISYTYASWAVHECPGHWDKELRWHPGTMWPEEAQAADFLARLTASAPTGTSRDRHE